MGNKQSSPQSPKQNQSSAQNQIIKLQEVNALLEKRHALLEKKIESEVSKARQLIKEGKKPQAGLCLKRKKNYETQRKRIENNIANNEEMIAKFEEASLNIEVFNAQKASSKTLKNAYGNIKPEDIDDQIADIQDTMADAEDFSAALSQPLATEDPDLDDEFEQLQEEMARDEMKDLDKVKVSKEKLEKPDKDHKAAKTTEEDDQDVEDEFAALEKEMVAS